jgi:hypothetical protein
MMRVQAGFTTNVNIVTCVTTAVSPKQITERNEERTDIAIDEQFNVRIVRPDNGVDPVEQKLPENPER